MVISSGLVRLRTIRLSTRVGAQIERRCSRSRGEDVTITDVIIKTPDRKWHWGIWMTSMPGSDGLRILGDFWKKAVSWDLNRDEVSWFPNMGEARPVGSTRCTARGGVRWNSQHSKKCVALSPRVENLKVKKEIKVSYLNYRGLSVFSSVFRIPMHMYNLLIRIFYIYEYVTVLLYSWYIPYNAEC